MSNNERRTPRQNRQSRKRDAKRNHNKRIFSRQLQQEQLEERLLLAADAMNEPIAAPTIADHVWQQQTQAPPLVFEANVGQAPAGEDLVSRISDGHILLRHDQATITRGGEEFRMEIVGANHAAKIGGAELVTRTSNYYLGDATFTDVPNYAASVVDNVYPNVDLIYYGSAAQQTPQQLEFDFVVAPGADPATIALAFPDALDIQLVDDALVMTTTNGAWQLAAPTSYQIVNHADGTGAESRDASLAPTSAQTSIVESHFVIHDDRTVGFSIGEYDPNFSLVIDPIFEMNAVSLLGGGGDESPQDMIVVGDDVYITGWTTSTQFTAGSGVQSKDAFLAKLNDDLTQIDWVTIYGGALDDAAHGIAVDGDGNLVIAGGSFSTDLVMMDPVQANLAGGMDAFVATFAPTGGLLQSTYFGGPNDDVAYDVATGASSEIYLVGQAGSNFPVQTPLQAAPHGDKAGFLVGFEDGVDSVGFSTYLGGSSSTDEGAMGVDVASDGDIVIAGTTSDPNFPLALPLFNTLGGASDAFLTRVSSDGSQWIHSTYLGGGTADFAYDVAVDLQTGDAIVAGQLGAGGEPNNGDATAWRIDASGQQLQWQQTWGGTATDSSRSVVIGEDGQAYLGGIAFNGSLFFPQLDPLDPAATTDGNAAFVAQIDQAGRLRFSSLVGGAGHDAGLAIGFGPLGIYLAGESNSASLATSGAAQVTNHGGLDGFAALIANTRWQTLPLEMLGQLERYAVDTVRYFTSSKSNNLLAGLTHSWFGQGPYRECAAVNDCTETVGPIASGFGSHVVINEATMGFNVLLVAYRMGWLDFLATPQQEYAATITQIIKGLETLRGLQTSGDSTKYADKAFYRTYNTTPDGADNDLTAEEIEWNGLDIVSADDNGLTIHNLLILRGMIQDMQVNEADKLQIMHLVDEILADIDLTQFIRNNEIVFEIKNDVKSPEVWDREVGEGVQILSAMLLTRQIDLNQFFAIAASLRNEGPTEYETPRGTIRIETPGFHAAMFQHGLRTFHGFPVTWQEHAGATFFRDSTKPLTETQVEFARDKGFASLGTQVMTARFNGHILSDQAAHPDNLARFAGNEFKEEPIFGDTMSAATAPHAFVVPLARFREMNPSDIIQILDWMEAYEADFYLSGSDTRLGFQAEIPHHPLDTTFTWTSQQDNQKKFADAGLTYDALNAAYTVLSIFDAFHPDAPLASYHAMSERTGAIAAYLDTDVVIDAGLFAEPSVEILPGTTERIREGRSQNFMVRLASQPLHNVSLHMNGQQQLMTNVTTLTFTPENWNQLQPVTVTAIDDYAVENLHFAAIKLNFDSADYYYDSLTLDDLWTVQIEDNEVAPSDIQLDNQIVPEQTLGAEIANISVVDLDQTGGHFLSVSDPRFEISNGVLRLAPTAALALTPSVVDIQLTVTDLSGLSYDENFTLGVAGISFVGGQVTENIIGAATGTLGTTIPLGGVEWTVGDARFETNGNTLKLKPQISLDFEVEPTVSIPVTAVSPNDARLTFAKTIVITNNDANDAPTSLSLSPAVVLENHVGVDVGSVSVEDQDVNDVHTLATPDERFTFSGTLLQLTPGKWLTGAGVTPVEITATDSLGANVTQIVDVTVLANPFPWHNPQFALDVTADGDVNITDLRFAFVHLSANGGGALPALAPGALPPPYWDVLADNLFNISDVRTLFTVLLIGEGEAEPLAAPLSHGTSQRVPLEDSNRMDRRRSDPRWPEVLRPSFSRSLESSLWHEVAVRDAWDPLATTKLEEEGEPTSNWSDAVDAYFSLL